MAGESNFTADDNAAHRVESDLLNLNLRLSEYATRFRCKYFAVMSAPTFVQTFKDVVIFSNWPPGILESSTHFFPSVRIDLFEQAAKTIAPIKWSFSTRENQEITDNLKYIEDIIQDTRLLDGLIIPVHGPMGKLGILALGGLERGLTAVEISVLQSTTIQLFQAHYEGGFPDTTDDSKKITNREKKCLLWIAHGKTSHEISIILNLSEHAVNSYINNVCKKLDAITRAHAVVKAIQSGIIQIPV